MGWTQQTRPDAILVQGTTLRFVLHYNYIPFVGVNSQLIQQALEADIPLFVSSVEETFLSTIGLSDEWKVQGSLTSDISVGDLSTRISIALNKWYSWGVSVTDIETETWIPDIPGPSTQTAISLAALAIIAVIGFLLVKKGGLL